MAKTPEQLKEWLEKQEEARHKAFANEVRKSYLLSMVARGKHLEAEGLLLSAEALSFGKEFYDTYQKACDHFWNIKCQRFEKVDIAEAFGVPKKRLWWQVLRDLLK